MSFIAEDVREILAALGLNSLDEVIGRTDLLKQVSRGASHLDDLDLNPLLVQVDTDTPVVYKPNRREPVPDTLDAQILRDAEPFFERGEKMQLDYGVRKHDAGHRRAVKFAHHAQVRHAVAARRPPAHPARGVVPDSRSARSACRACCSKSSAMQTTMSARASPGATIVVRRARATARSSDAVMRSSATPASMARLPGSCSRPARQACASPCATQAPPSVVEGCGANGCEYMTDGRAVILGPVGDNFGAGMTGGAAYIWDPSDRFAQVVNPDSIDWYPLGEMSEDHIGEAKALIEEHSRRTGSLRARELLDNWEVTLGQMLMIVPKEVASMLLARKQPAKKKQAERA